MTRSMPLYTGIRMPNGQPPTPLQNGRGAEEQFNKYMNDATFDAYMWRLMEIAISVFEWKNLPKGVDARQLELWLLLNGYCVFFYDEDMKGSRDAPEGYAVLQASLKGSFDLYNYPNERNAYAANGVNIDLDESNSVIVFNSYLRTPTMMPLDLYARRLAELDRTIDVNVVAQKTPKIIRCPKEQRLSFRNIMMQYEGNIYSILADENVDLDKFDVIDLSAPFVADDLQSIKYRIWNEALTFLGVENINTEKKERLISSEVMTSMGDVESQRFTRLNARKQACQKINDLLEENGWFNEKTVDEETGEEVSVNKHVDCDFRSGIYIKADGYGSQQIATTGMKDSTVLTEKGTGYEQDDRTIGMIARIKSILGMEG